MRRKPFLISLFLFVSIIQSCDPARIFDKYMSIDEEGWDIGDAIRLETDISDTVSLFTCYINVRNTTDYPYSNLYLFIKTIFPNGNIARDTVQLLLADKEGKWLGKGIGKIRDNQMLFIKDLRFPYQGRYIFEITQAMREKKLIGIKDIGMRITKQS